MSISGTMKPMFKYVPSILGQARISITYGSIGQVRYRSKTRGNDRKNLAKLIRKTNRSKYNGNDIKIDIASQKPQNETDFVQTNYELRKLADDSEKRVYARYTEPNIYWKQSLNLTSSSPNMLRKELEEKFGAPLKEFKQIDVLSSPLNVGDLVELGGALETSQLCCVVELPSSLADPRYTFVDTYGDIIFASKSRITWRIPKVFPSQWLQNVVLDEKLFNLEKKGIKQIGKPKFLTEDALLRDSTKSFYEQALINNGHNLNQLDTFVIPSLMSQLLAKELTNIIAHAWEILPIMNSKLELVHNLLQDGNNPVVINTFQLFKAVGMINMDKIERKTGSMTSYEEMIEYYSQLSQDICKEINMESTYATSTLGKQINFEMDMFDKNEITSFYAMMLGLMKNNRLFEGFTNPDPTIQFPLSVTMLPLSEIVNLDLAIEDFKEDNGKFEKFLKYLTDRLRLILKGQLGKVDKLTKPRHYDRMISLMKLYCSSSSKLDAPVESFLLKIFRNLPDYSDMKITSSLVYDALFKLGERSLIQNPVEWSLDLLKPASGSSSKADLEQELYDQLTNYQSQVDWTNDFSAEIRQENFDDIIYCIDDASAYEIDDGISISQLDNEMYQIKAYIADPASYLSPDDVISKIAFERASTVYFPDINRLPVEMLPVSFVKLIELRPGKPVRAMQFSFMYNGKTKCFVENSLQICPTSVKKLVNITYKEVNLILDEDNSALEAVSKRINIQSHILKRDLTDLWNVTTNLSNNRLSKVSTFKFGNSLRMVNKSNEDDDHGLQLSFSSELPSKSETIVTEVMVHTNALTAKFLSDYGIPSIYRTLKDLPLTETVQLQLEDLRKDDLRDTMRAANFMAGTSFSLYPKSHNHIGLGPYCTVTSPLRRFQDLYCHWQLQSFLKLQKLANDQNEVLAYNEKLMFNQANVAYVLAHISSRNFKLKQASKKSTNFFIYKKLKELPDSTRFKVMISSRPKSNGEVEGVLLDYGGIRCILKSSMVFSNKKVIEDIEDHTKQNLNSFSTTRIGDIVEDSKIEDIDLLSGDVMMVSESF